MDDPTRSEAGESYATWKVAGGCQAVVVRSPHCPPEEMPT